MHTLVTLDDGLLTTRIVSEVDCDVSQRRWRAAIFPAVALLRSLGGGSCVIPHRPMDLLP